MSNDKNSKNVEINKPKVDLSRRRVAKLGLLSVPIFSTIPGKSALAGNCTTLSGMLSGNLSSHNTFVTTCESSNQINHIYGCSDVYWKESYVNCTVRHEFPSIYNYESKCTDLGFECFKFDDYTILEIFHLDASMITGVTVAPLELNFLRLSLAAYFSALASQDYFISANQVIDIYNAIGQEVTGSYIEPATLIPLDVEYIIDIYTNSFANTPCDFSVSGPVYNNVYDNRDGYFYFQGAAGGGTDADKYYRFGIEWVAPNDINQWEETVCL